MAEIYTFAIAGAGRAADELTLPAFGVGAKYCDLSRARVAAIADSREDKAARVAQKHGVPRYFNDVGRMLREVRPDVLVINTPVAMHYQHAMLALQQGVNFILEKPATDTLAELREIKTALEKSGVKGTVVHNYKFKNGFQQAWSWFEAGTLGSVLHIERVWMSPPQGDRMEMDRDGWWHKLPGGRLADSLPHHLYVCYPLVGPMEVEQVAVRKLAADRPWSKCDEANIVLRAAKAYVNIRLSTNQERWPDGVIAKGGPYDAIIYGTRNSAVMYQDRAFLMNRRPDRKELVLQGLDALRQIAADRWASLRGRRREMAVRGGHNILFNRFIRYLDGTARNPVPWDEAIEVMRLTQEIGQSMESKLSNQTS